MRRLLPILFPAILAAHSAPVLAQSDDTSTPHPEDREVDMDAPTFDPMVKVGKVLIGKDSVQYVEVNKVYVYPEPEFKDAKQRMAYNRLVYNIKKVEHMKRVEKDIKREYTPRMKKLTYAQGKLCIKLVYRECNSSSYQLIQAFLGPIRAGFYQAFAALFGASLTKKYDPNGVDRLTERVVRQVDLIQSGSLHKG